jgi:hypothetical protein
VAEAWTADENPRAVAVPRIPAGVPGVLLQPDTAAAMAQLPINVARTLRAAGREDVLSRNAFLLSH